MVETNVENLSTVEKNGHPDFKIQVAGFYEFLMDAANTGEDGRNIVQGMIQHFENVVSVNLPLNAREEVERAKMSREVWKDYTKMMAG